MPGLTTAGLTHMLQATLGEAGLTPFDAANSYMGVGDSATAFDASQTDLLGTNKYRKAVDTGSPSRSGLDTTWVATFGTTEANFNWQEAGIFNASSGGTMLFRIVWNWGVKTSAVSRQLTLTLSLSAS